MTTYAKLPDELRGASTFKNDQVFEGQVDVQGGLYVDDNIYSFIRVNNPGTDYESVFEFAEAGTPKASLTYYGTAYSATPALADSVNLVGNTVNIGKAGGTVNLLGSVNNINATDVYVPNDLEVDGVVYADGGIQRATAAVLSIGGGLTTGVTLVPAVTFTAGFANQTISGALTWSGEQTFNAAVTLGASGGIGNNYLTMNLGTSTYGVLINPAAAADIIPFRVSNTNSAIQYTVGANSGSGVGISIQGSAFNGAGSGIYSGATYQNTVIIGEQFNAAGADRWATFSDTATTLSKPVTGSSGFFATGGTNAAGGFTFGSNKTRIGAGTSGVDILNTAGQGIVVLGADGTLAINNPGVAALLSLTNTGALTAGPTDNSQVHDIRSPTQTTVGAAGGASAVPATPTGYVEIKIKGTAYVIPYYAKS